MSEDLALGDLVVTPDEDASIADTLDGLADYADAVSPITVERVCRACAAVLREEHGDP